MCRIASRNPATASLVGADCVVESDWRALLDPDQADGIIIATPPAQHFEMAMAAVQARIPVFVEKPLTMDLQKAEQLRRATAATGCLVMVDHIYLHHPAFQALKLRACAAHQPRAIRALRGNWGPFRPDVPVLWDWGSHDVAMCIDLLGSRPRVTLAKWVECRHTGSGLGEIVDLKLDFPDTVDARIRIGNIFDAKARYFAVHFDDEVAVFDDLSDHKLTLHPPTDAFADPEGDGCPVDLSDDRPLTNAIRSFARAISEGRSDLADLDLSVEVVRTLGECEAMMGATAAARAH